MCLLCFFYYIHYSILSTVCQELFSIISIIFTVGNICYIELWLVFVCYLLLYLGLLVYSYCMVAVVACRLFCGSAVYICNQIYLDCFFLLPVVRFGLSSRSFCCCSVGGLLSLPVQSVLFLLDIFSLFIYDRLLLIFQCLLMCIDLTISSMAICTL
jgi:hypothetical protein